MTNDGLNNEFDILYDAINSFSEKYKIDFRLGHSWRTFDCQSEDERIVKEVYISREFNKCYQKMFYIGINKYGNVFIENKKSKLICKAKVNEISIHNMLLHFISNYLKFFVNQKTYSLIDFISK